MPTEIRQHSRNTLARHLPILSRGTTNLHMEPLLRDILRVLLLHKGSLREELRHSKDILVLRHKDIRLKVHLLRAILVILNSLSGDKLNTSLVSMCYKSFNWHFFCTQLL